MKCNRTVQNALWLISGKTAQMGISLVVGVLTARYLGPSDYGLIHYAAAYTGFFASFCTLGINSVLVKELTDAPGEEGVILGTSLFLRGISSILSALVILCVVYLADGADKPALAVVGLSSLGMLLQIFDVFHCWFQARLRSKVTAAVLLAAYTVTAVYKTALLLTGRSVLWFAFAGAVEQLCAAVLLLMAYRRHGGGRLGISRERGRLLLQKSCHFILPGLMVAVYAQTDKIMLKQLIGEAEIGYYSTAVSACNAWCFVLSAIIDSAYPAIARAHKREETLFRRRNRQLYALVFYLSAGVSLLLCCCAGPLVTILYGKAYLPAAAPLRILTWYTAFSYLGVARNAWVVCENRQKYLIWVYGAAAVSNVLLNLLLIPRWGASGAAAASLVAQVVTALIAPFLLKGLRENGKLMLDAILLRGVFGKGEGL